MSINVSPEAGVLSGFSDIPRGVRPWSQPEMFKLSENADQVRVEEMLRDRQVTAIHDPIEITARALFESHHPESKDDETAARDYVESVKAEGESFGTWVYFPWSGVLSRYPDQKDHQNLRLSRNRDLITAEEQAALLKKRVAVFGLSVGSKALSSCVEGGIGGSFIIADGDYLDPTNTNRIDAGYTSVGESKISIAAKKISEKDPWIEQIHLPNGVSKEVLEGAVRADLIVEEVDSLEAKAFTRLWAQAHGVPLVMAADIGDKSVVDVERYDLGDKKAQPFLGRIAAADVERISQGGLTKAENLQWMKKHTGIRHLSVRMMRSAMAMGKRTTGLPQLGMTATRGGAEVAFVAREILLGRELKSGRYADSPRRTFRLPRREYSVATGVRTAMELSRHMRNMK